MTLFDGGNFTSKSYHLCKLEKLGRAFPRF